MSENILEYTGPGAVPLRIDKARGILYGVKILGTRSRNGRRYPVGTLKKAIPLYENAKVNIDHPDEKPRRYTERIGVLCNVQLRGEDGLYADFHFNPRHPLVEQLLWDAEHAPSNVGFSHNVEAVVRPDNNEVVVEEILTVRSVDLVADPATTAGLFESVKANGAGSVSANHVATPLEDFEVLRIENETMKRKLRFLELMLERIAAEITEPECRYLSCFKAPFLEAVYRCTGEEEVRRLIADRLELVRRIKESGKSEAPGARLAAPAPAESQSPEKSDHRSFLEAILGQ